VRHGRLNCLAMKNCFHACMTASRKNLFSCVSYCYQHYGDRLNIGDCNRKGC